MDKQIIIKLILPLSLFASLSVAINNYFELDGFFINLATELIGIIVTVLYVDFIIKKRETEKWNNVEKKVSHALRTLVNATISTIRTSFGYGIDIIDYKIEEAVMSDPKKFYLMEKELIRISKEILEPTALSKVNSFNRTTWSSFNNQLQYLYESDIKLLTVYGSKLTPIQYELLIEIQDELGSIMTQYSTWPDILGVPDEELPKGTRIPTIEWKESLNELIADDIRRLLNKVRELEANLCDN
jgi:hypothetical protein